MKVVIVSPDIVGPVRNGGIGTFVYNLARLLRTHGDTVTILFTGPMHHPRRQWECLYLERGIRVLPVRELEPKTASRGNWLFVRMSQSVADAIPDDTDIVYVQDWQANGFVPLRRRRYAATRLPLFVNVLHGGTAWLLEGMGEYGNCFLQLMGIDSAERYVAAHADFVVSPSRYMVRWAIEHGWALEDQARIRVLGYPYFPALSSDTVAPRPADRYRRIVFFGRLERRKGLQLFRETLAALHGSRPQSLASLDEIILLGKRSPGAGREIRLLRSVVQSGGGPRLSVLSDLDMFAAQRYLTRHAADSLVVMPALLDNYPFALIEASLIPGIHALCSDSGGIPEVLNGAGHSCSFPPYPIPFEQKLDQTLQAGPRPEQIPPQYPADQHNKEWLQFHEELGSQVTDRKLSRAPSRATDSSQQAVVDVCIPHFNQGLYLPHLLKGLEQQTTQAFRVYVVDDCSTAPNARRVFEQMKERYAPRGWRFESTRENSGLSQTRNLAASLGQGAYLVFVDADNVPAPNMVARLQECIATSGDDCLTAYMKAFASDKMPYVLAPTGAEERGRLSLRAPISFEYLPLGPSLELALFENFLGDANFIIRRHVFEDLGGFTAEQPHYRFLVHEDYEFLTRLIYKGYRLDVVPEYLVFYRDCARGLSKTTDPYQNMMRVHKVFRTELRRAGLEHLVPAVFGLYARNRNVDRMKNQILEYWPRPWGLLRFFARKARQLYLR